MERLEGLNGLCITKRRYDCSGKEEWVTFSFFLAVSVRHDLIYEEEL